MRDLIPDRGLTRPGVDHIRVRLRNRDRPHGRGCEVAVGDVTPGQTAVGRLPDATGASAEVKGLRVRDIARDGDDAPTAVGADASPGECCQEALAQGRGFRVRHSPQSYLSWLSAG